MHRCSLAGISQPHFAGRISSTVGEIEWPSTGLLVKTKVPEGWCSTRLKINKRKASLPMEVLSGHHNYTTRFQVYVEIKHIS